MPLCRSWIAVGSLGLLSGCLGMCELNMGTPEESLGA